MAESGQAQPTAATAATSEFGESEYGNRLDYGASQYRDWWAAILFVGQFIAMIIGCIIGITKFADAIKDLSWDQDVKDALNELLVAVLLTMLAAAGVGCVFALLWLKLIQMYAETIIKVLLGLVFLAICVLAIMSIGDGDSGSAVVFVIFALLFALYCWCIKGRIPFAGTCLAVSSVISQTYPGVIGYAFISVLCTIIYLVVAFIAIIDYAISSGENFSSFLFFLMLISWYWGPQVWRNVSHTTTCGTTATWYFNPGELINPSRGAFKRTMTTSFGSVCFGALIVAILQALRSMIKSSARGPCACIAWCLLACIERLIRFFNKYAFCQVAIYGSSFWEAAKATWDLFVTRGILAVVNDNLAGLVLVCGSLFGAIIAGIVCSFVFLSFFTKYFDVNDEENAGIVTVLTSCGWTIGIYTGYFICAVMLSVIQSGVTALFVCLAEDPAAGFANRQPEVTKLLTTNAELGNMAMVLGVPIQAQPVPDADGAAATTQPQPQV